MKHLIIIFLLTFISEPIKYQTYMTAEVIEQAESYLEKAVGDELFKYFKRYPYSYYEYKTKTGKKKSENINKCKRTKGNFVKGNNIRFILPPPEFSYLYVNKRISFPLTSELELESEIKLERIPAFLTEGKKSDWLHENQLDSIIE